MVYVVVVFSPPEGDEDAYYDHVEGVYVDKDAAFDKAAEFAYSEVTKAPFCERRC